MKLNYECVRDVLKYLEKIPYVRQDEEGYLEYEEVCLSKICESLPDYSVEDVFYALSHLQQAGYINVSGQWGGDVLGECCVNYITFEGHEFLEKIKSDTIWKKTLSTAGKVGSFSFQMIAKIAESVAVACIKDALG